MDKTQTTSSMFEGNNTETEKYIAPPYFQNRELSWLEFNKRVLDQAADVSVPLLERLKFVSIFSSNLQEFFMVRVGSISDLELIKGKVIDHKTGWTPHQQLKEIYARCHELYPYYEDTFNSVNAELKAKGIRQLKPDDLTSAQKSFAKKHFKTNILPFLSPQIVNSRHPFPHLTNGALYIIVRLNNKALSDTQKSSKGGAKKGGAKNVTLGIIPLPAQCRRIVKLPGVTDILDFILLEDLIDMFASEVFSMYKIKHTNIVCVTRNADLDVVEGDEEQGSDYREHMKKILKKRSRLHPVRLESARELSDVVRNTLQDRLELTDRQTYVTSVPLDMSYAYDLANIIDDEELVESLSFESFTPQWTASIDKNRSVINQACEHEILLSYPYETMDAFDRMLKEAAYDPSVVSIKITLYRLASHSQLAEALIQAAENGKEVTALFELRARFDEFNNIEWSQRFEEAGCNVLYGFRDFKTHSKICLITRKTPDGLQYITQLGTGNYNEKTARLYTDFSFITTDENIGKDAGLFFQNMQLEQIGDNYEHIWVAPLQIKQHILDEIDKQIALKKQGQPAGLFFKTNSITDEDVIKKLVEASQAGVECTLLVRGISCILPGIQGYTDNICVVSIVGRLLEHSRIYCFGPIDGDVKIYLSSADLMTRNLNKRVEIAWQIENEEIKNQIIAYIGVCMSDTEKLRALKENGEYTPLGYFRKDEGLNSQQFLIDEAVNRNKTAKQSSNPATRIQQALEVAQAQTQQIESIPADKNTHVVAIEKLNALLDKEKNYAKEHKEIIEHENNSPIKEQISAVKQTLEEIEETRLKFEKLKSAVSESEKKKEKKSDKNIHKLHFEKNKNYEQIKSKPSEENTTIRIDNPDLLAKEKGKQKTPETEEQKNFDSFINLFPDENKFKMPKGLKKRWKK